VFTGPLLTASSDALAFEKPTLSSLRSFQHVDVAGNPIGE
jgi:hypothetical protein